MFFLLTHTAAAQPANSVDEAGERILAMLQLALDVPRSPILEDYEAGYIKFIGDMNIAHGVTQAALCLAYREITGKPAPDKYQVDLNSDLFPAEGSDTSTTRSKTLVAARVSEKTAPGTMEDQMDAVAKEAHSAGLAEEAKK